MDVSAADISPDKMYRLIANTVVPRPIALVSSLSADGVPNAAPFSFFNAFSNAPPLLIIGIDGSLRGNGEPHKDTARNIIERGEFVVNLVSRAIAKRMVVCSLDFPDHVSEFDEAGFTPRPSKQIAVPGIAESPISFECRVFGVQALPNNRNLITGEIVHIHMDDDLVDADLQVDGNRLDLVGRIHGAGWYTTMHDRFEMLRMSVDDWERAKLNGPLGPAGAD